MKILPADEAQKLTLRLANRGSWLRRALQGLQPGQAIVVKRGEDWHGKATPYEVVNRLAKQLDWRFDKAHLLDGSGWVFTRVE